MESKLKQKNINRGYCKKKEKRNKNDKYLTPYSMIQQLLDNITLDKNISILEPCCSEEKTIIKMLEKNGFNNLNYNIYDSPEGIDFLDWDENDKYDCIISNTPYGNKTVIKFIKKMKKITDKIILLYPINYLNGKERYDEIYNDEEYKLSKILQFIRFPMLEETIREDGKYKTGMTLYGWFIFEKGYKGDIILKQIDNDEFVYRKSQNKK